MRSHIRFCHRSLAVFISILFLSSVAETTRATSVKVAQQKEATSPKDADRAAAARVLAEADNLLKQGTNQSQRQAIAKYEQALPLLRATGETRGEAIVLRAIGTVYEQLKETQKALNYYNKALPLLRAVKDRYEEALTLGRIGLVYYFLLGDYQKTLDYYNEELAIYRTLKDRPWEASILDLIGGVYDHLSDYQKALDYYNEALAIFRSLKNRSAEAYTLGFIGIVYHHLGKTQSSLDSYNSALELWREVGDRTNQADTLSSIGSIYTELGETQRALDSYNSALELQRGLGNRIEQANTLSRITLLYGLLGDSQKALDSYNSTLELLPAKGPDRFRQALILLDSIAGTYLSLGKFQLLVNSYNRLLELERAAGTRDLEAETLYQMGLFHDQLGEKQKALDLLNQALVIQQTIKAHAREASTLREIGGIYNSLGEPQQALDFYNRALKLQRVVKDRDEEAVTLNDIADCYNLLGEYQLSIDTYNQALEIFRLESNLTQEAYTLNNIGSVYRLVGDYRKALDYFNQALLMARTHGNRELEDVLLSSIVRAYESLGDYQNALGSANQMLSVSRIQKNPLFEGGAFGMMGRVYLALGNYQKALESLNQALPLARTAGSRLEEANILGQVGRVYNSSGKQEQALNSYTQELSLRRALGDRYGEAETLYNIALVERKRGNLKVARTQIEATLALVESLRTKIVRQELRASYFASLQKYYQFKIDLLMQLHKQQPVSGYNIQALETSERARARVLLELLAESHADIRQGVEPKLLEQERKLQQQLDALEQRRLQLLGSKYTTTEAAALEKDIKALLVQYQEVQGQIRETSPRYAALTQPQPLTLAQMQQMLEPDTLLLEYSLGKEHSYLWLVTSSSITSYELPKQEVIETTARQFYHLLTDKRFAVVKQDLTKVSANLSQMLLEPVASQLGKKRLVIVSDGALQYVPFTALPLAQPSARSSKVNPQLSSPMPLLVEHEIVSLPSASTLAVIRRNHNGRQPAAKALAVLADPVFGRDDERFQKILVSSGQRTYSRPAISNRTSLSQQALERSAETSGIAFHRLQATRQEAEQILALVPISERKQAWDFAANRSAATSSELSQYRIVHFATHGVLNSVNPELSGVVFSLIDEQGTPQNGFLPLYEIFNLSLPAELVVLSACETGLGKEIRGEGLVGLTRGFMYAGTPRVVVSLWSVNDKSTAQLMVQFYKGMLEKGLPPAAALRAAQLEMWKQQSWQSPYYWAPFVLQGEWR